MRYFTLLLLTFCLLGCRHSAVSQASPELIPRTAFFQGESRSNIQLSPAGDWLYFQSSTVPNAILSLSTQKHCGSC